MIIKKETKWLCENARRLEQFSGKWIMFSVNEGLVSKGDSLNRVLKNARKKRGCTQPYIFHVPSKDELCDPIPVLKVK